MRCTCNFNLISLPHIMYICQHLDNISISIRSKITIVYPYKSYVTTVLLYNIVAILLPCYKNLWWSIQLKLVFYSLFLSWTLWRVMAYGSKRNCNCTFNLNWLLLKGWHVLLVSIYSCSSDLFVDWKTYICISKMYINDLL